VKKVLLLTSFAVVTFLLIFPRVLDMPQILNNVRAKNLCSCLFIEELPIERCRGQNSKSYPYYGEEVDYQLKKVSFSLAGLLKSEVRFEADFGCRLKKSGIQQ
jgi:hypothetical protein